MTTSNTADSLLRLADVAALTALPKSTIYERIRRNAFPAPIKLGERLARWSRAEVEAWVDAQVNAARGGAP